MEQSDLKKMIDNIGAMAEIVYLYYKASLNAGASMPEAMILAKMFLEVTIEDAHKFDEDDGK